jgi:hypothetical protein
MTISQFFSVKSLFEINRVMVEPADKALMFVGLVLVVLAILFKAATFYAPTPVDKKYRGRFFNLFAWIGISELIWYAARAQYVRFFGTRFVALFILLIGLCWLVPLVVKSFRHYSAEKDQWEKDQLKQKYLPKQA